MKININKLKNINWGAAVKKNKYGLVSVVILLVYFYATFSAISFIVRNVRTAFSINDELAKKQAIHLNFDDYEAIAKRFHLE